MKIDDISWTFLKLCVATRSVHVGRHGSGTAIVYALGFVTMHSALFPGDDILAATNCRPNVSDEIAEFERPVMLHLVMKPGKAAVSDHDRSASTAC